MSDTIPGPELRAILARIDRDLADSAKLREESNKMREESSKFIAEQRKLMAESEKLAIEALKLHRDRWLAPWLAILGLIGGLLAIANFVQRTFSGG